MPRFTTIPKIVTPLLNLLNNKKTNYYIDKYISFIKIDLTNRFIISNDIYYLIYEHLIVKKNNKSYINNINNINIAISFFSSNANLPSYYAFRDTITDIINNEDIKNIKIIKNWKACGYGSIKINNIILINNNLYITILRDSQIESSFSYAGNSSNYYIEYIYNTIKKEYNLKKLNLYLIGHIYPHSSHLPLKKIFDKVYIKFYSINKGNIFKRIR